MTLSKTFGTAFLHNLRVLRGGLLVLVLCLTFSACHTPPGAQGEGTERSSYWPLFTYSETREGDWRARSLGPIGEVSGNTDGRREEAVRPFYSYLYDPVKMEEEVLSLYPIGRFTDQYRDYGPAGDRLRGRTMWLFPLFYYNFFSPRPGEYDIDYYAPFPIVIGGSDSDEGDSFAILPFGGTIRGQLGVDEIDFIGGPLYVATRDGEIRKWWFPFPLVYYGTGPGYDSWGFLPFYGQSIQAGEYERYTALWPLISWGRDNLSSSYPRDYFQFLPFYGEVNTEVSNQTSVLWPFFNYGRFDTSNAEIIDAPWPFFRYATGDNYEEFRIWPLYAGWRRGNIEGWEILWPFIWKRIDNSDERFTEESLLVVPFWYARDRVFKEDADGYRATMKRRTLWPLINYKKETDGDYAWTFPYVLPYFGPRFERQYREIFNILTIEGGDDHYKLEVLWGLLQHEDIPEETWNALHPLFSRRLNKAARPLGSDPDTPHASDSERTDLLYGLLGSETTPDGFKVRAGWFFEFDYSEEDPKAGE